MSNEPELPPDTHCPHGVDMDPKLDLPCHYCDEDRLALLRSWVENQHFLWHSDDVKFLLERGDKLQIEVVRLRGEVFRLSGERGDELLQHRTVNEVSIEFDDDGNPDCDCQGPSHRRECPHWVLPL